MPAPSDAEDLVHILSPFDPLIIQRKRMHLFFDYEHRFEAYVPKEKRLFGYFALPVLVGDEIVALLDLKTDRGRQKLLLQRWTWFGKRSRRSHRTTDRRGAAPVRALSARALSTLRCGARREAPHYSSGSVVKNSG